MKKKLITFIAFITATTLSMGVFAWDWNSATVTNVDIDEANGLVLIGISDQTLRKENSSPLDPDCRANAAEWPTIACDISTESCKLMMSTALAAMLGGKSVTFQFDGTCLGQVRKVTRFVVLNQKHNIAGMNLA